MQHSQFLLRTSKDKYVKFFSMSIANNVSLDMDSLFQFRTSILFFLHVALLRSGIWVDNIALYQCSKFQWKIAWKFSKLPEKMLGSFGRQLGTQTATNIAWNVQWTFQPIVSAWSEEILVPISEMYRAIQVAFGDRP